MKIKDLDQRRRIDLIVDVGSVGRYTQVSDEELDDLDITTALEAVEADLEGVSGQSKARVLKRIADIRSSIKTI